MKFFAHQGHSALQATGFSYLKIIPHEKNKYFTKNLRVQQQSSILRGD
jgi:hypothetical protein